MLSDLCQQTGLLGQPEEYFRPDFRHHWSAEWGLDQRGSYALYVASAIRQTSSPNGVFGVKMHSYQMNWFLRQLRVIWGTDETATDADLLARWLPNAVFVHLKRRDVARQAISYYRAVHSNVWFEMREDDPAASEHNPQVRPQFGEEPAWEEIRYLERGLVNQERMWTRFFKDNGITPLRLCYEDIVDDPSTAVRAVLDRMGIEVPEGLTLDSRLKRQSDETTQRWLEEYLARRSSLKAERPLPERHRAAAATNGGRPPNGGTEAATLFPDEVAPTRELVPADYIEGRVTWAEIVADLVLSGLSMGAAATLVDALPGEGAKPVRGEVRPNWRRSRTPLPDPSR